MAFGNFRLSLQTTAVCVVLCALPGCSSLPNSGPSASDVSSQQVGAQNQQRYVLVDITPSTVAALQQRGFPSFAAKFGDRRPSREPVIGIGDSITVTIWEAAAGGLFSAPMLTDKVSSGANSAVLPEQVVGRDGGITVPYAGRIHVVGQTTRGVQASIEKALEGKAIQPQVLVNVTRPVSQSVSVGGEVATGARIPLSTKGDRILEVINEAGGIRAPVNETFVELSRGFSTARVPLKTIVDNPRENIYLLPNDIVTLVRDPQTFLAYGATGRDAEIPFDADGVNLAQALSKAGGLLDYRSDPAGVFVFRYEQASIARKFDPASAEIEQDGRVPVVYRLNLADANSLFLQQRFQLASRDLIYVSNAPSTEVQKMFDVIGGGMSTIGSAASVASAGATLK